MATPKYRFFEALRVRFAETDMQGHVFFGTYLTYFDEALTRYQNALGVTYQDMLEAGVDMFYIHAECDFKSRAFFEEVLNVHARAGKIGNSSITFEFAIFKGDDELVATGNIIAVIIDPQTKKPVRVPDVFREAVARYEGERQ